jgi:hypothetical protein
MTIRRLLRLNPVVGSELRRQKQRIKPYAHQNGPFPLISSSPIDNKKPLTFKIGLRFATYQSSMPFASCRIRVRSSSKRFSLS